MRTAHEQTTQGSTGRLRVSVIVPVRDQRELLSETLDALARQTYDDLEVIVVDDGSTDGSGEVAAEAALPARVVHTGGVGAVGARIVGVAEATGDVLAFTDSDCVPEPGWVAAGAAAVAGGADVVQGATRPARKVEALERSLAYRGGEGLFATCNVFYRRSAYEAAGGFDAQAERRLGFRPFQRARALGFGEDTLLGWRVARQGNLAVADEAIVHHAVLRPRVGELVWRGWVAGGFPELVRQIPELRQTLLRRGVFLGPPVRLPLYVAAVGLLTGRRREALAAVGWWVGWRWRSLRGQGTVGGRLLALPVELALDLVTAAALVAGSLRSRSMVL